MTSYLPSKASGGFDGRVSHQIPAPSAAAINTAITATAARTGLRRGGAGPFLPMPPESDRMACMPGGLAEGPASTVDCCSAFGPAEGSGGGVASRSL
ncbi:hypothetical protein AB0346_29245 [Nocardia beijingensis]|uniref:hypothetical protein n=1 Tax=Nocardia beijingensis TaxID=95162 RepID=UPI00344C8BFA